VIGLAGILGWVVVGVIVAAVEKRSNEGAESTVVCVIGAIVGAFVGRTFGLYIAFGEIVGFVCAAVGAKLLLSVYRSQFVGVRPTRSTPLPDPILPTAAPPPAVEREQSIGMLFVEAFAWAVMCALASAVLGFIGHVVGSRLYPQPYEQIPSDFVLVPLGLLVGFVAAGIGRLAARDWSFPGMFAFVALVSIVYGGAMFQYSRVRAVPAQLTVSIDPNPLDAVRCDRDCNATDPPLQWTIQGRLRVKETSGLGGTVDYIELTSNTESTGLVKPQPYSKERAAEANRWRGPTITLTGRQIPGPRHLTANEDAIYQIRYSYRTPERTSRRRVTLNVHITDGAGRKTYTYADWNVW
jgi:uncharacterized membrane protein YeaQ/YmgE (transglycosylase-associated protein family)